MEKLSIVGPVGYNAGTCGYCGPPGKRSAAKTSRSYGIWAYDLSPVGYQSLMDNGWRRSGSYVYRPDNLRTCCAQHTIRLETARFQPSKSQKRTVRRLEKWARTPLEAGQVEGGSKAVALQSGKGRGKGKYEGPWDLEERLGEIFWEGEDNGRAERNMSHLERAAVAHEHRTALKGKGRESSSQLSGKARTPLAPLQPPKVRKLEAKLFPASSTNEKYALFRSYQKGVHKEGDDEVSDRQGFERFLCRSPIARQHADGRRVADSSGSTPSPGPSSPGDPSTEAVDLSSSSAVPYGLYHMEYRLEGELVAVAVLDILPKALSSVYLFYEPKHAELQLGKISALREIALTRELGRKQGMEQFKWYYMGYYIHSCPKMRYKGEYRPSQLLDPVTAKWTDLERIKSALDQGVRLGWLEALKGGVVEIQAGNGTTSESKADDEASDAEDEGDESTLALPKPLPPGFAEPTPRELGSVLVLDAERQRTGIMPFAMSPLSRSPEKVRGVVECLSSLPPSIDADFVLFL